MRKLKEAWVSEHMAIERHHVRSLRQAWWSVFLESLLRPHFLRKTGTVFIRHQYELSDTTSVGS